MKNHTSKKTIGERAVALAASGALALSLVPAAFAAGIGGDTGSSASGGGTPPEMPDGQNGNGGTPPTPPDGQGSSGGMGGTPPDMPQGEAPDGAPGDMGGGPDTQSFDFTGTYIGVLVADGAEVDSEGESFEAIEVDQNAALVENGGVLTVVGDTFTKSGDDNNGDNCNFYGLNSIVTAVGSESVAHVSMSSLSATSTGSNGIFATDHATVYAYGDTIATTADNSRGLDVTYGGVIVASDMTIETEGDHCAALATDRGGGYVSAADSTLRTEGSGSPLLYSTGDIEVNDVTGIATGSQLAGMEGYNTILISDSTLASTNTDRTGSDPVADAVIIYQSTSGDADTSTGATAVFKATGSDLSSAIESGAFFYLTNTTANVVLQDTTLGFDTDSAMLMLAAGNDANNWGTPGSNGAAVTFSALAEELEGDIAADAISSVDVYLLENTTWTGATEVVENDAASSTTSTVSVNVDSTSSWVVTESCEVYDINVENGGAVVDEHGATVSIVSSAGETFVEGDSSITVTVYNSYSTGVTTSDANSVDSDTIDRSGFDGIYDTDTDWRMGAGGMVDLSTTTSGDVSAGEGAASDGQGFLAALTSRVAGNLC